MLHIDPIVLHIAALVRGTNNGKLMIARIESDEARTALPGLIASGWFERCMFLHPGDAIRCGWRAIEVDLDLPGYLRRHA